VLIHAILDLDWVWGLTETLRGVNTFGVSLC
jgi:hypothetical protein